MASRDQIIQRFARMYRDETNSADIDLSKFANYLITHGVTPPPVPSEQDLMARAARRALKQEIRRDREPPAPRLHRSAQAPRFLDEKRRLLGLPDAQRSGAR